MKLNKKVIAAAITVTVILSGSAFAIIGSEEQPEVIPANEVVDMVEEPIIEVENEPPVEPTPEPAETADPVVIQEPVTLNIDEFARQNFPALMEPPAASECLQLLVEKLPQRFNDENRQDSLTRLSKYANICAAYISTRTFNPVKTEDILFSN